jgi:hypothetical protein
VTQMHDPPLCRKSQAGGGVVCENVSGLFVAWGPRARRLSIAIKLRLATIDTVALKKAPPSAIRASLFAADAMIMLGRILKPDMKVTFLSMSSARKGHVSAKL